MTTNSQTKKGTAHFRRVLYICYMSGKGPLFSRALFYETLNPHTQNERRRSWGADAGQPTLQRSSSSSHDRVDKRHHRAVYDPCSVTLAKSVMCERGCILQLTALG